jgi:hypothetical protein
VRVRLSTWLLIAGCSFNSGGLDPTDGGKSDAFLDDATHDGASCDVMEDPCCQQPDQRLCVDEATTGACSDGELVTDRQCPAGSTCNGNPGNADETICELAPSSTCETCTAGQCDIAQVCTVFATSSSQRYCCVDAPAGGALPGELCAQHDDCASRVCIPMTDGSRCMEYCALSAPCEADFECESFELLLDGQFVIVPSCAAQ